MSRTFVILLLLAALCGCAGGGRVAIPVVNKSPDRVIPEAYQAASGDSIYKIAWAFGLDYRDIAEWNNLEEPYAISEGQVISLKAGGARAGQDRPKSVVQVLPGKPEPQPVQQAAAQPAETGKRVDFASSVGQWKWPAEGKLVMHYSPDKGVNGIQIAGKEGSPVRATAAGEVVYIGEGLRGYGKLIILKHAGNYVSAYAHNRDIQVAEGQQIGSGEQIATMGNSGTDAVKLHFEIRKNGNPVDPETLLK